MASRRENGGGEIDAANGSEAAAGFLPYFDTALTGSRITVAAADHDGRYTWVFNPPEALNFVGKADGDMLATESAVALAAAKSSVVTTGEPCEIELEVKGEDGPRWYDVVVRAHRDGETIRGTVLSFIDVTDRKIQEEHLRIVLRELAHRSKNLLAVIQGIARQTAESASSTQQFVSRFNGRIFSLSRAHDVLTDADWRGARIFDLVRSQIALYAEGRLADVSMKGENGFLRPNAAQYVGLALHELTTNAVKYGALSREHGKVAVTFEKSARSPAFYRFSWEETSRAEVRAPKVRSFGLVMLAEVVPTSVSGTAELRFEPEGLSYHLEIPKAQLVA